MFMKLKKEMQYHIIKKKGCKMALTLIFHTWVLMRADTILFWWHTSLNWGKKGWQFPELLQGLRRSWKFQLYFQFHVWGTALSAPELGSKGGISLRLEWWIIWVKLWIVAGFFIQMKWFQWVKLEQSLSEKYHHVTSVRKQIWDIIMMQSFVYSGFCIF